ncbi:MAG: hypothetical protein ACREI9_08595 [Nitrospiraceae bacterium]
MVTKVFTDIQPNQSRVWFWALWCSQCGHLADAGLRPDSLSCVSSWDRPFEKPPFES